MILFSQYNSIANKQKPLKGERTTMGPSILIGIIVAGWILGILIPEIQVRKVVGILRIKGPLPFDEISRELGMGFRVENKWLNDTLELLEARGDIESLEKNAFKWAVKNNRGMFSAVILRTWYLFVLPPMTLEDEQAAAIFACTAWLEKNRRSVAKYLGKAIVGASKREGRFFVSVAVNTGSYQYFYFWVTLPNFTFTQASIKLHREAR